MRKLNSKVAILTDTHFGKGKDKDSDNLLDYFEKFYDNVFFPTLKARGITQVFHLGDLVDSRKFIKWNVANVMRRCFLSKFSTCQFEMMIIPGNHDCLHVNTTRVNALNEMLSDNDGIVVINEPREVAYDWDKGERVLFLPWICRENEAQSLEMLRTSNASIVMAHLELQGFRVSKTQVHDHGMESNIFRNFKRVFTGHFHHRQTKGNIHYLGAPYQQTWDDWNEEFGFHIYDFETDELEFIPNPYTMFEKIQFDPSSKLDMESLKGKRVKLYAESDTDSAKFLAQVTAMQDAGVHDVTPVEAPLLSLEISDVEIAEDVELEDTLTIVSDFIDIAETSVNKDKLKKLFTGLYKEAQNIEA